MSRMHSKFTYFRKTLILAFKKWSDDRAPRMAAALAFYTIFSLAPFFFLMSRLGEWLGSENSLREHLLKLTQNYVGGEAGRSLSQFVAAQKLPVETHRAAFIGIAIVIFSALGSFVELKDALNTIWNRKSEASGAKAVLSTYLISLLMILMIGGILFLLVLLSVLMSGLQGILPHSYWMWEFLNFFVSLCVTTVLFATLFKILPAGKVYWRDMWRGAALTALFFNFGKIGIGLIIARSHFGSTYGSAASIISVLMWVYYTAQIFYIGAEFTVVDANTRLKARSNSKEA